MQKPIDTFHEYVMGDVLGHIDGITSRKMFGGYGIYLDGVIFSIITDDGELRFKVDDSNMAQYEERGSTPFLYTGHKNKKPTTMPYWLLPEEIMEDREKIEEWVRDSARISQGLA